MDGKRFLMLAALSLFIAAFFNIGFCQGTAPGAASVQQEKQKVTVEGTIAFSKELGSYVVVALTSNYKYLIANPIPTVLDKLAADGRVVKVEGRQAQGVDFLLIETIDGQNYQ